MSSPLLGTRLIALLLVVLSGAPSAQSDNPDDLYRNRTNSGSAKRAADLWEGRAASDFDAAWKLARACYWLGTHGSDTERRAALERGVKAGQTALHHAPNRPEGHFWLAANMGGLAESFGLTQGLKYRGRIKDELERAIAIDPRWEGGVAEAALGRWYAHVPRLLGGSGKNAETHFRRALAINPESRTALVGLAELLIGNGRKDEARALLTRAISAPLDPEYVPEDQEAAAKAAAVLRTLK